MTRYSRWPHPVPGRGERIRVVSPTTGREWSGVVIQWLRGAPKVRTDAGDVRYFPGAWVAEITRDCPDGGTCHHECGLARCWRVDTCEPLSGVYPGNQWPEDAA